MELHNLLRGIPVNTYRHVETDDADDEITKPLGNVSVLYGLIKQSDLICLAGLEKPINNKTTFSLIDRDELDNISNEASDHLAFSENNREVTLLVSRYSEGNILLGVGNDYRRILFNLNRTSKVVDYQAQVGEGGEWKNVDVTLPNEGLNDLSVVMQVGKNISSKLINGTGSA